MGRYDIAIIGTGPAGISAAITAKIRNKNIILLGGGNLSDKISQAHRIDNYPGLPAISGADFASKLGEHLEDLGIEITEAKVGAVYAMTDHFSLQVGEEFIEASSVIVASGVVQTRSLEGEGDYVGRGVSYCATCDGRLYRGKKVAVIGYSADAAEEAEYLAEIADRVLYFRKNREALPVGDNIEIMEETPVSIAGGMKADTLVTDGGSHETDCVFVLRDAVPPDSLVPGVETDGPHIRVNLQMETNLPGLFACGDIAGKPYQYVKSAGQGNVAALSAVTYLASKDR